MGLSTATVTPGVNPTMKSETLLLLFWKTLSLYSPVTEIVGVMVTGPRRGCSGPGGTAGLPGGRRSCVWPVAGPAIRQTASAAIQPTRRPGRFTLRYLSRTLGPVQRFFRVQLFDRAVVMRQRGRLGNH